MRFTEKLRRMAYTGLNSPPFLNQKYALRHHLSNAQTLINDVGQAFLKKNLHSRLYEKDIAVGVIFFSVASICNARCIFCAYKDSSGPKGIMDFKTFKKAADEYARMGGKVISFSPTIGEPLLDSALLEKITYAVNLEGIEEVQFYTNGILLGKDSMYKKLVDSGIHEIKISMAETDRELYNRVYGVKAYDTFMAGLHKLLSYNSDAGEKVRISLNFRSSTGPDGVINSPDFVRYIKPYLSDKVMYDFINDYDNWGGTIRKEDLLGVMRMRRIPKLKKIPCTKTFDLRILHTGDVRLCACRIVNTEFDELVVGSIHGGNLRDIFYGRRAAAVRKAFGEGKLPPVCKTCSLYAPATERWLKARASGKSRLYHKLPFSEASHANA